jgi:hypothetical protein
MMKYILAIIISATTTGLSAETLSFPSFQMEIPDGWEHTIENEPADDGRSVISLRHPNGVGTLKLQSYDALAVVGEDNLRNLTNLELSIPLAWQSWGDYSGYQYSYVESDSYFRQWWLTNDQAIIFVVYQCDPESKDIETEDIDKIVRSITVNEPGQG